VEYQNQIIERQNAPTKNQPNKAGDIRQNLLSQNLPHTKTSKFAALYTPSYKLGGDIYDIFHIDDELTGIVVADASGHDSASAALSKLFKTTLNQYAYIDINPSVVLQKLNADFCKIFSQGEFFTAFYAIYNSRENSLIYSNAAHPRAMLYSYNSGALVELDSDGFLLGVSADNITFESKKIYLDHKQRLFIYTDGVNEASNIDGMMFGVENIKKHFKASLHKSPRPFLEGIEKALKSHTNADTFEDDLTMVVMDISK
jgi:sigma-B regulation protein RsbU (phosphoserine phosphatase)